MSYTRWHATWFDLPNETTSVPAGFIQHVEDTFVAQDGRITTLEASGGGGTGAVTSVAGRTGVVTLAKADVGLNNVDNTSDVNKPVSTLQTTAINTGDALAIPKTLVTAKGNLIVATASGTPTNLGVGADTQVLTADSTQATGTKWATPTGGGSGIPASTTTTKGDLLAATASATVTRLGVGGDGQVLTAQSSQSTGLNWTTPTAPPVTSVASRTGTIVLTSSDVGLANVNNTSDVNKPVSTAQATADALAIPKSIVTTKGDILGATGSAVVGRLGIGADFTILSAASSQTTGMQWINPNTLPGFGWELLNRFSFTSAATTSGVLTIPVRDVLMIVGSIAVLASVDIVGLKFNGNALSNHRSRAITCAAGTVTLVEHINVSKNLAYLSGISTDQERQFICTINNANGGDAVGTVDNVISSGIASTVSDIDMSVAIGYTDPSFLNITSVEMRTVSGVVIGAGSGIMIFGKSFS